MLVGEIAFRLQADTAAFSRAMSKAAAEVRALKSSIQDMHLTVDLDVDKNAFRTKVRQAVAASSQNQIKVDLEIDTQKFRRDLHATVAAAQGNAVKVDLNLDEFGFRNKVKAAVSGARGQSVKANLDLDETGFRRKVQAAVSAASGKAVKVNLDIDQTGFRTRLREQLASSSRGLSIKVPIHIDSTGLRAEIRAAIIAARAGQRIDIPMGGAPSGAPGGGGGAGGSIQRGAAASIGSGLMRIAALSGLVLSAIGPVITAIGALSAAAIGAAGALGPLTGLLAGYPVAFLGAAAAMVIFKENAKELTPVLKDFASKLQPAINAAGQLVKSGLTKGFNQMGGALKPLRGLLIGVGGSIGFLADKMGAMLGSDRWIADLDTLGRTTTRMTTTLGIAGLNIMDTVRNLAVSASPMITTLSQDFLGLTQRINDTISRKRDSGELAAFFSRTRRAVEDAGKALGLFWDGLMNIMGSGGTSMGQWLQRGLVQGMANFKNWTDQSRGAIDNWFTTARPALSETAQLMKAIFVESGHSMNMLGLAALINQLRTEFLPVFGQLIRAFQDAAPLIINIATALGRLMALMPFGPILLFANAIATMVNAFTGLISQVPGLSQVAGVLLSLYTSYRLLALVARNAVVLRIIGLGGLANLAAGAVAGLRGLGSQIVSSFTLAAASARAGVISAGRGIVQAFGGAISAAAMSGTFWVAAAVILVAGIAYVFTKSRAKAREEAAKFSADLSKVMGDAFSGVQEWYDNVAAQLDPKKAIAALKKGQDAVTSALGLYARDIAETLTVPWDGLELVAPVDKINEYYERIRDAGMDKNGKLKEAVDFVNRAHDTLTKALQELWGKVHEPGGFGEYESRAREAIKQYREATDKFLEAVKASGEEGARQVRELEQQMKNAWLSAQTEMTANGISTADIIYTSAQKTAAAQEGGAAINAQAAADSAKIQMEALKKYQDQVRGAFEEALSPTTYLTGSTKNAAGDMVSNAKLGIGAFATWMQNTIKSTQGFLDNYRQALKNGFNPSFLAGLLAEGPEKASDAMKLLAQTTSSETVRMINDGVAQLSKLTDEAVRQAGILQRAIAHPELTAPGPSGKSKMAIASAASAYITAHPKASQEDVAKGVGASVKEVRDALESSSLDWMLNNLTSSVTNFGKAILSSYTPAMQELARGNVILGAGEGAVRLFGSTLSSVGPQMGTVFRNVQTATGSLDQAKLAIEPLVTQFTNLGREAGMTDNQLADIISTVTGIPRETIMTMVTNVKDTKDSIDTLKSAVTGPMTGHVQIFHNTPGVKEALEKLGFTVTTLPNGDLKITATDQTQATLDAIRNKAIPPIVVPIQTEWGAALGRGVADAFKGSAGELNKIKTPSSEALGRASGGWVYGPGTSTSDSVPARLSTGEYVVNARAAAKHGAILHRINNFAAGGVVGKDGIPGFAGGGMVTAVPSGNGISITGTLSPFTVTFQADASALDRAIASLHSYSVVVTFLPDLTQVYVATAGFHPVAWVSLDADLARAYATVAAFHPVTWLSLSIDPTQFLGTLDSVVAQVAARMQQLVGSENFMAAGVNAAVNFAIAGHTRLGASTDSVEANSFLRMHQFVANADFMADGVNRAVDRAIAAHTRLGASTDSVTANHGTRMNQIVGGANNMAGGTEGATNRVINAYTRMQGRVDALHNKDIKVTSTASVNYPPNLGVALGEALGKLSGAQAAANGMIRSRAGGGLDNLPGHAQIAAGRGPGVVQWAEGETGGEAFIPLATSKRARSLSIWERTGQLLGAFASGGLVNIDTTHADTNWHPKTAQLQVDSENIATKLGIAAGNALGRAATARLTSTANARIDQERSMLTAGGGGGGFGGLANAEAVVALARSMIGHPYQPPYYDPSGFSCDGLVWWVFNHFGINTGRNAEYQIHNAQPISEAESKPGDVVAFKHRWNSTMIPGSTYGHIGIVSGPNKTINALGHAYGVVESSITGLTSVGRSFGRFLKNLNPGGGVGAGSGDTVGKPGQYATYDGYLGKHWTQSALEFAVRKQGGSPSVAHLLGAIAMAEAMPIGKFIGNSTGMYTGAWAFQKSWAASMYDWNRLSNDLDYDAMAALRLYNAPGPGGYGATHMKWQVFPQDSARYMGGGGIIGMSRGGVVPGTGNTDSVPALLTPGEVVIPKMATGGIKGINFAMAGYKPAPGASPFGGNRRFMGGQWSPAGNWTSEKAYAKMTGNQKFAYWSAFPEVVKYLTFNSIAALARAASATLHHPPAGYLGWNLNKQFAYWSRFPKVVALLKAMAAQGKNITNKPKGDIWHGGHYQLYGKQIPGMAAGGPVSADTLAQLHGGEYVVNALAAKRYGPLLDSLNAKRTTPAGSLHTPAAIGSAPSGPIVTHNWNIRVEPDTKPQKVARELSWEFAGARGA